MIYQRYGINHIEFGHGGIFIARGQEKYVGIVSLIPADEPMPVGESGYVEGEVDTQVGKGVNTRLVFTTPESVEIFIEELIKVRNRMNRVRDLWQS